MILKISPVCRNHSSIQLMVIQKPKNKFKRTCPPPPTWFPTFVVPQTFAFWATKRTAVASTTTQISSTQHMRPTDSSHSEAVKTNTVSGAKFAQQPPGLCGLPYPSKWTNQGCWVQVKLKKKKKKFKGVSDLDWIPTKFQTKRWTNSLLAIQKQK